jgi:capsular exopolysaccharide synthesis family protein
MSKIFDALQRSESERGESKSAALPQGPELLREAERRAASDWETAVSVNVPEIALVDEKQEVINSQLLSIPAESVPIPLATGGSSPSKLGESLASFSPLPISVKPEGHLVCLQDWKSPAAEAIRLLAVRLRDLRRHRTLKKVVITSTVPREGKSTISSNLACALARRADEKVLIIEGDVRLPVVHKLFGIDQQSGICDLLRGERSLKECVFHLLDAGVWVMPAGKPATNPLEILQSKKLSIIMDQLAATFDWIVIDSPPVLPLADTSIWMRQADGVLLVTRLGVTDKKQLQKGLEALEPQKVLGALLNGTQASRYSSYYYGNSKES